MTRPHGDHRSWLTAPLQGGPPWTTKVRLVAFVSVVVIFSPILIVVGAIMEGVEFATKLFGTLRDEVRQAWEACDREAVRRLLPKEPAQTTDGHPWAWKR